MTISPNISVTCGHNVVSSTPIAVSFAAPQGSITSMEESPKVVESAGRVANSKLMEEMYDPFIGGLILGITGYKVPEQHDDVRSHSLFTF
jgi:hypothetical protein